jgi:hypothetical protein
MKLCASCGRRQRAEHFTAGKTDCKRCRSERARELRREVRREREDAEYQRRHEEWRERRLAEHEAWNQKARELGWEERPLPYLGMDWLERLQERAAKAMARPQNTGRRKRSSIPGERP